MLGLDGAGKTSIIRALTTQVRLVAPLLVARQPRAVAVPHRLVPPSTPGLWLNDDAAHRGLQESRACVVARPHV